MYNIDLYTKICNGNIHESLIIVTELILIDNQRNINILENTLISICSYIGSYINIYDIKLWLDIVNNTFLFIQNEKIEIKNIYILITKMCIICDIYLKNPITKTGNINLKLLREKILDVFDLDTKLSINGLTKFELVLPPIDSDSYKLSLQIISGFLKIFKTIDELSLDDANKIVDLSNKLRNCFDYIIRKKYTFETKYNLNDNDCIWFLWGIIYILYNEDYIKNIFNLFIYNYTKKIKNERIGLLWGCAISIIYTHKKNIARNYNNKENILIEKIEDSSMLLYKEIKNKLNLNINDKKNIKEDIIDICDGLEYMFKFIPIEKEKKDDSNNINNNIEIKSIKYK